jgi:hypothetical protein
MLGYWRTHDEYQQFVSKQLLFGLYNQEQLIEYQKIIQKLWILNLDPLKNIIEDRYSNTGRPSVYQPEIFRTYILMQDLHVPISQWIDKLKNNFVLRTICGFLKSELPSIASFYSFIERITGAENKSQLRKFKRKPKEKLKQGEKLPPKHPGITQKLKGKIIKGYRFKDPVADVINKILALAVRKSLELGLINLTINISGDGTCMRTGASPYGKKLCECNSKGVFNCNCPRKFSDPTATWGWDSHNEKYFYGYTGYFISTYDKTHKIDLPLYIRVVDAKRHDSVSAIVSIAEFRDLYTELNINAFMSDSASDNYATYELLEEYGISAVIALGKSNNGNNKYPVPIKHENGTPICPAGHKMVNWGVNSNDRCRRKWRCSRVLGRTEHCDTCDSCSPSNYGRVVYTKVEWDPRLFCRIARDSDEWKQSMKERTACERINNRVLNDYGVEKSHTRGKKRIFFFTMIAAINIHLDAQLKIITADNPLSLSLLRDIA